jgi:hypothetical protein
VLYGAVCAAKASCHACLPCFGFVWLRRIGPGCHIKQYGAYLLHVLGFAAGRAVLAHARFCWVVVGQGSGLTWLHFYFLLGYCVLPILRVGLVCICVCACA